MMRGHAKTVPNSGRQNVFWDCPARANLALFPGFWVWEDGNEPFWINGKAGWVWSNRAAILPGFDWPFSDHCEVILRYVFVPMKKKSDLLD